jgi:competence protein ComEC
MIKLFRTIVYHGSIVPILCVGTLFVLCQMLGFISEYSESMRFRENRISRLVMVDVGQGDGFIVRLWNGNVFFVDVGEFAEKFITGARRPAFENFGKKESLHADLIFLTHDDADHAGALQGVWKGIDGNVGSVVVSPFQYSYVEKLKKENANVEENGNANSKSILKIKEGDSFKFYSKKSEYSENSNSANAIASIDIISPHMASSNEYERRSANDDSITMRVSIASTSIMFTGDISEKTEHRLVDAYGDQLGADILKVGHHGSKTSSSVEFLKMVNPRTALISVGKNNRYKHPTKQAMKRITDVGAEIIRTDKCGTYQIWIFKGGAIGRARDGTKKPCY